MTPPAGPHPQEEQPSTGKHNLPAPRTSFVGREREMVEVKRTLAMTRLLTLTGAGDTGKTRLAIEVARDLVGTYPDGAQDARACPPVRPREAGAERGGGNHKACSCRIGFGNGGGCRIRLLRRREDRSAHDLCAGGTISRPGAPRPNPPRAGGGGLDSARHVQPSDFYRALDLRAHGGQPRRKDSQEARPPLAGPHRQLGKRIVASNLSPRLRLRTPRLPRSEPFFSGWGRK
jgi:DNA polymerase III delta prime subunit